MARLMVIWTRPCSLPADEARRWACAHVSGFAYRRPVRGAALTRIGAASDRHPAESGWLLELHLDDGADAHAFVDEPGLSDWLLDLEQLGLRPRVILADNAIALRPDRI